jgi:serine/threonine protein kinase
MRLSAGERLGPYQILSPLGVGGMGEVYRARDISLGRDVALKVLPDTLARSPDRMARFEREAQLLASLNHPNIASIYGFEESGGTRALVMELVDGPTLAERMGARAIPLEDALPIARQIAEAIEHAHERGIIHRDLKPANVKLTAEGRVKVLDFGLAKALETQVPDSGSESRAPTRTLDVTGAGMIMGTAGYMAPEQARGRPVDKRADIWAFGVILYEMVTGRRLFAGESPSDTLAEVLTREPAWEFVPESVQPVLRLCLQKDPKLRLRDIGDAKHLLDSGSSAPISTQTQTATSRRTRRQWLIAGTGTAACLSGAAAFWHWSHTPFRPKPLSIEWYVKGVNALRSTTYETARKALEQAVSADPQFALAHASLAQAYQELDYSERAKDSMLKAVGIAAETRLSWQDQRRLRSFQLIVSREYERAAALLAQMESDAGAAEKPAAALEFGWLAQRRERTDEAVESYSRALKLDPSYAPAKLRLGYMLNRKGNFDLALGTYQEAEQLYQAASDYEGIAEAQIGQANLLIRFHKGAALPMIEKARATAGPIGSSYLNIRLDLLQGVALRTLGEPERAAEIARKAIDAADALHMDNLASSALVDLGNAYLSRRDLASAESVCLHALSIARRSGVRRHESRALLELASICEQSNRPEDARRYIEASLPFYREGGYRREVLQANGMLGGILCEQAQYDDSIRVLRESLPDAVQLHDAVLEAQLRERLAEALFDRGEWPEALAEADKSAALFGVTALSFDIRRRGARIRWKLGRRDEAARWMASAEELLRRNPGDAGSFDVMLLKSEMAYEEGQASAAAALARQALALPGALADAKPSASFLLGLALIRGRHLAEGMSLASAALDQLDRGHQELAAASFLIALGEALADSGRQELVLAHARQALEFFEPRENSEAVWRAHVVAARATTGDESAQHLRAARTALDKLRAAWPREDVVRYLDKPDIRVPAVRV